LRLAQDLLSWAGTRYLELLTELNKRALEPSTRFHTSRSNIQAHSVIAQTLETPVGAYIRAPVHRNGWGLWCVITTGLLLIAGGFGWLGATAFPLRLNAKSSPAQRLFTRSLSISSALNPMAIRTRKKNVLR